MAVHQCDKAGNAGDVLKHAVLDWLLTRLVATALGPIYYVETHAGRGFYLIDPRVGERQHLLNVPPVDANAWTAPYARVIASGIGRHDAGMTYPGSPAHALTILQHHPAAYAAFFESCKTDRQALSLVIDSFRAKGVSAASVHALRPTAFTCAPEGFNPFAEALQAGFADLHGGCQPGFVFAFVDPFSYDADCEVLEIADGGLDQRMLARVVEWSRAIAGPDPSNGIVMVWTKTGVEDLYRDLGEQMERLGPAPTALRQIDIATDRIARRYSVCVAGWGEVGAAVVGEIPATNALAAAGPAAWRGSALLDAWKMRIRFPGNNDEWGRVYALKRTRR